MSRERSSLADIDLKEQILGDLLYTITSCVYEERKQIQKSVNAQELDLNFKIRVHRLVDNRFEFAFHPAMAIANLLDPNFHGKSLGLTDFEMIIISYIEKVYKFEEAAHKSNFTHKFPKFPVVVELACQVLSIITSSAAAKHNWSNFRFIHSKLGAHLNNNWVKKLVAIYQNLRTHKEIKKDIWLEKDEV
ncbi:uncharacterized protein LOC101240239 [Rhizophagus clarus]|uniref:Uncharacterized protein LOC101240239 n=1 Tax=Rhizophagus clarus TaxID=94130 RepID=A0A8H3QVK5_9GLOM|nr:uncharacterized protein LOC101240239 [Rhizophagus clarus]